MHDPAWWVEMWNGIDDPDIDPRQQLDLLGQNWARLIESPGLTGASPFGWREGDYLTARLSARIAGDPMKRSGGGDRIDHLFVASEVFKDGGHTGWMADCIRVLDGRVRVLVTNPWGNIDPAQSGHRDQLAARLGVEPGQLRIRRPVFEGRSVDHAGSLDWLLEQTRECGIGRLWLFHHPQDVAASGFAAIDGITNRVVLAHHADAMPCCGLYLPRIVLLDPSPPVHAWSLVAGLDSHLLPLTCPDPQLPPRAFLQHSALTTCCAGRAAKFKGAFPFHYDDVIRTILTRTNFRHIHYGPVAPETWQRWLGFSSDAPERLTHVEWVPSLAAAMHADGVDVCLSSVPAGGLRTSIEAMAAGIPYWFQQLSDFSRYGGMLVEARRFWTTPGDLVHQLQAISVHELSSYGKHLRSHYESNHHPDIFAGRLHQSLEAGVGDCRAMDPRDLTLAGAMEQIRLQQLSAVQSQRELAVIHKKMARLEQQLLHDRNRIDRLKAEHKALVQRVRRRWWRRLFQRSGKKDVQGRSGQ